LVGGFKLGFILLCEIPLLYLVSSSQVHTWYGRREVGQAGLRSKRVGSNEEIGELKV
jgi:hypothetical protein